MIIMDMFLLHRHIKRSLFVLIYTDVLLVINCILKYVSEFNYVLLIYFVLNMLKSLLWILAKTKMNWCTLGAHQVQPFTGQLPYHFSHNHFGQTGHDCYLINQCRISENYK